MPADPTDYKERSRFAPIEVDTDALIRCDGLSRLQVPLKEASVVAIVKSTTTAGG